MGSLTRSCSRHAPAPRDHAASAGCTRKEQLSHRVVEWIAPRQASWYAGGARGG